MTYICYNILQPSSTSWALGICQAFVYNTYTIIWLCLRYHFYATKHDQRKPRNILFTVSDEHQFAYESFVAFL